MWKFQIYTLLKVMVKVALSPGPRGSNRFFNSLSKAGFKFEKFNLFNEELANSS